MSKAKQSKATRKAALEDHSEAQRLRILKVARQRFIEQGFHAASMNSIAEAAGISAGLSYRYFENKRAIILAIIDLQLAQNREGLGQLSLSSDLVEELVAVFQMQGETVDGMQDAVLFSEITVASARDAEIAEVLRRSEAASRGDFIEWLAARDRQCGRPSDRDDLMVRALLMQCLFDGLMVRSSREPDLDVGSLRAFLRRMLPLVLGEPAPATEK